MDLPLTPARPRIMDGAMGTELIARGMIVRKDIAERWVIDRPDDVREIHAAYAQAGAQVLQTNTFGAIRARLAPHDLSDRIAEIGARAIELARGFDTLVVASLGPSGLPGESTEIEAQLAESARALRAADAIHLETQCHPAELVSAARGIRTGAPDLPLWISITVVAADAGLVTPLGVPIDRMIRALREAAPDAVGVNCSLDGERIRAAVERLLEADLGPVIARPQARISEKCATGRSTETPERFAARAIELFRHGVAAVGGCCGTHPGSINALSTAFSGTGRAALGVSP